MSTETQTAEQTVTINGVEYTESQLSDNTKQLITIYKSWENRAVNARVDLMLIEGAMRDLTQQIVASVEPTEAAVEEVEAPKKKAKKA